MDLGGLMNCGQCLFEDRQVMSAKRCLCRWAHPNGFLVMNFRSLTVEHDPQHALKPRSTHFRHGAQPAQMPHSGGAFEPTCGKPFDGQATGQADIEKVKQLAVRGFLDRDQPTGLGRWFADAL